MRRHADPARPCVPHRQAEETEREQSRPSICDGPASTHVGPSRFVDSGVALASGKIKGTLLQQCYASVEQVLRVE